MHDHDENCDCGDSFVPDVDDAAVQAAMDEFWVWFGANCAMFEGAAEEDDECFDTLELKGEELVPGLVFQVPSEENNADGKRLLIVSSMGYVPLFDYIDALVERAPEIAGWQPVALQPPLHPEFEEEVDGRLYQGSALRFAIVEREGEEIPVEVCVTLPWIGKKECNNPEIIERMMFVVFAALGERMAGIAVDGVKVVAYPGKNAAGYVDVVTVYDQIAARIEKQFEREEKENG
jgi:hypothetical protein